MTQKKVLVMVDGYNLYYSLCSFVKKVLHGKNDYLWCDLFRLAEAHLKEDEVIDELYYCSAPYETDETQRKVQEMYMQYHIDKYGEKFKYLMGKFSKSSRDPVFCPNCNKDISGKARYKEKQTDVNVALKVIECICTQSHAKIILASGDTDYEPLFKYANGKQTEILRIIPPSRHAKFDYPFEVITGEHIQNACFADEMPDDVPEPQRYPAEE